MHTDVEDLQEKDRKTFKDTKNECDADRPQAKKKGGERQTHAYTKKKKIK